MAAGAGAERMWHVPTGTDRGMRRGPHVLAPRPEGTGVSARDHQCRLEGIRLPDDAVRKAWADERGTGARDVMEWLTKNLRIQLHFTLTSGSWR